jgi:hypothetical protein
MAAPALFAAMALLAISSGVTGTAGLMPVESAELVTAQATMTGRDTGGVPSAENQLTASVKGLWRNLKGNIPEITRVRLGCSVACTISMFGASHKGWTQAAGAYDQSADDGELGQRALHTEAAFGRRHLPDVRRNSACQSFVISGINNQPGVTQRFNEFRIRLRGIAHALPS